MTDFYETAIHLQEILADQMLLLLEPEVIDFTSKASGKVVVEGKGRVEFEISPQNTHIVAGLLQSTVFNKDKVKVLYGYNIKPLFSYLKFFLKTDFNPMVSLVDVKVIESFLNLPTKKPQSINEAIIRAKQLAENKVWGKVYKQIHLPLITKVLPAIETTPLLDESDKSSKHPYYEIEGQINGRLNSLKKYRRSYLPHTLSPDIKLKPIGYDIFLQADFKACEVVVLQWLSKDEVLKEVIASGQDVYKLIFKIITGKDCLTPQQRTFCKRVFLPVMYGLGPKGLAKQLKIEEATAEALVNRIHRKFSVATQWMQNQQQLAKEQGYTVDAFGRPRTYKDGEFYLARNFAVQGVAATICQEKVIQLHNALKSTKAKLCFVVHDAVMISCPEDRVIETSQLIQTVLEKASDICADLTMKVEIKYGKNLSEMKNIHEGAR